MAVTHAAFHTLSEAHSPTWSIGGWTVYVVCGWHGCQTRVQLRAAEWEHETARRQRIKTGSVPPPVLSGLEA